MKRITIYLLLLCMTLQCASRIGVLSYVYQQRHALAYQIGILAEIPIAMCNSDFDFDQGLHIEEQKDASTTLPVSSLLQAREINLFIESSCFDTRKQLCLDQRQSAAVRNQQKLFPS